MAVKINDITIMGDDGKFTPEFNPGMLGEEYKDSKFLETTPDLVSLMKAGIDTKSALGKKLEGHIAPLGENATDDEKAAHRKSLMSGLGTSVEKVEDYGLVKPEDWPENVPFDEENTKVFADFLFGRGWPKEEVQELVSLYNKNAVTKYNDSVKQLKSDWKGDALIKKARTAAKAMVQFGTDELVKVVNEAGLITTPDDFKKWQDLNISAAQIRVWANIGEKMKSDSAIPDEGSNKGDKKQMKKSKMNLVYDHSTSQNMT